MTKSQRSGRRGMWVLGLVAVGATLLLGIKFALAPPAVFTVEDRIAQYGAAARARMAKPFEAAGVAYPPPGLIFLGLKNEKRLEIYAKNSEGDWVCVLCYPILAASGEAGPKLREGDRQVPEGFYRVELLNPNSRFHLSLRLNYPNAEDQERARAEGRDRPGSDIMIHGSDVSIGCLAMGDDVAEELFVLASDCGLAGIQVLLAPCDLRVSAPPDVSKMPAWMPDLYQRLGKAMNALKSLEGGITPDS